MAVSMPSGLGASFGYVAEVTVGTAVTVSRWTRIDKEGFSLNKTTPTSVGLHQGLYQESKRRNFVAKDVNGAVSMDLQTTQMGLLFKHCLGVNTTGTNGTAVVVSGTSYKQNHAPGDATGLGLTVQIGRPLSTGTIQQFTYPGCKILDWTISQQRGQLAKFDLTFDAWNEDVATAYAAPTFTNVNVFDFSQGSLLLGGTATTTTGVTSVASGAAPVGIVQSVLLKGTNALKTDRFTLGSQTKKEQLANGFRAIDVECVVEFGSMADFYTSLFASDTSTAVEMKWTGGAIAGGGGNNFFVDAIVPAVFWDAHPVIVQGPDVITVTVKGVGLDDGTNNPVQLAYQSTDAAI